MFEKIIYLYLTVQGRFLMRSYNIGEVSAITNISRDRIRNYEKKGIIFPDRDKENDYRIYSERDIVLLQAVEVYRYADFGMDEISSICTQGSVDDIINKAMNKSKSIDKTIENLNILKQRNLEIIQNCEKIKENLNICSVKDIEKFDILGEIDDYTSFEEYSRIYSADMSEKPVVYKIQRMLTFNTDSIKTNKMIITRPSADEEKERCLYMIVKDGENTDDALNYAFPLCLEYCRNNALKPKGTVYIAMLLMFCENKKISTFLEIKAPLE